MTRHCYVSTNFPGIIMDKSKIELVTGGSGGIGSVIALSLAKKGFDVRIAINGRKRTFCIGTADRGT
jgi:NAD(P)-dependent dehydrogenase (short-subunit alcohol dehydrogenase family)